MPSLHDRLKCSSTPDAVNAQVKQLNKSVPPNTILGICADDQGNFLAGVKIEVYSRRVEESEGKPKLLFSTKSDNKGKFRLDNFIDIEKEFPRGLSDENFPERNFRMYSFLARSSGRVTRMQSQEASWIVRRGDAMVFWMPMAKTLRGQVTDDSGQPVVGALITAGLAMREGIQSARTDANGQYEINDLEAYDHEEEKRRREESRTKGATLALQWEHGGSFTALTLLVKHPKFAAKRAIIKRIPGTVNVQLVPGSVIEGKIEFPEGEAIAKSIAGRVVRLQRALPQPKPGERPDQYSFQIETSTIDEKGHYRFESLPAGKYHLTADIDGWVTQGIENVEVVKGETTTAPDILLTRGGRVRVQLIDDKTSEPMRFEVPTKGFINPIPRPQRAAIFMSRNSTVEFSIEGVGEIRIPAGKYAFSISIPIVKEEYLVSAMTDKIEDLTTYEIEDGKLLELSIRLRKWKSQTNATLEHFTIA